MQIIFAYGDSITWGATDLEMGGWANRVRVYLDNKAKETGGLDYRFYNLGIPGESTEGLKKRFVRETEARLREGWENVFIFAYGMNDLAFLTAKNGVDVEIGAFEKNLNEVIAEAKKYGSKIMLINLTPVVEEITKADKKKIRHDEDIFKYNEKIREIAEIHNLPLADAYAAIAEHGGDALLTEDGVHPSAAGHQAMFEAVKSTLEKVL